ncbi:hypothetical protein G6F57_022367 [Rhizopus arrhizus]|nr:hypothetical protein G6F57_022367 [Rhizopus arrhizus]
MADPFAIPVQRLVGQIGKAQRHQGHQARAAQQQEHLQALTRQAVDLAHFAAHQATGAGGNPAKRISQAHGLLAGGGRWLTLPFPPDPQPTIRTCNQRRNPRRRSGQRT